MMCFPFVSFVFFVVRYISTVFNWSFPDNRVKVKYISEILENNRSKKASYETESNRTLVCKQPRPTDKAISGNAMV